jgi:hypothetical protein
LTQKKTPACEEAVQFGAGDCAGASPSNDKPFEGTNRAKEPTEPASLAIRASTSLAIAFPAADAMSELIAALKGALSAGETGPAVSLLQPLASITPAAVRTIRNIVFCILDSVS